MIFIVTSFVHERFQNEQYFFNFISLYLNVNNYKLKYLFVRKMSIKVSNFIPDSGSKSVFTDSTFYNLNLPN